MDSTSRARSAVAWGSASVLLFAAGALLATLTPQSALASGASRLAVAGLLSSGALGCLAASGACAMGRAAQQGRVLAPLELLGVTGRRIPVLRTLAFAFGLVALSLCVDAALRSSGLRESSILPELDREISRASSNATPAGLVLLVLGLAVAPGVAEELLFRGWLLRVFARPFGLARSALITTALFGALHVDPLHAAAAAVLGGYLAAVRIATGSTSAAIACHVANNLAALWIGASEAPPISIALPVAAGVAALSSVWLARTLRSQAAADALTLPGLSAPGHER